MRIPSAQSRRMEDPETVVEPSVGSGDSTVEDLHHRSAIVVEIATFLVGTRLAAPSGMPSNTVEKHSIPRFDRVIARHASSRAYNLARAATWAPEEILARCARGIR